MTESSTVRLLLLGDLHLSTTGPAIPPACPDLETLNVDAIVSIGDIIDDNRDHASDASAGEAYERRGRQFFERLAAVGVPVLAVPGNHDPVATTRRLADGLDNVTVLHRCAVDGGELDEALSGMRFAGWGCEQFDLTPAFRYDRYPGIVPESAGYDGIDQRATKIAETVESAVGRYLAGRSTATETAAELGVDTEANGECVADLSKLKSVFERIREVLAPAAETSVILSHESPFHVAFDYHHSANGLAARLHRGSIPLKMAIVDVAPDIVFSGHMHSQGRDAIKTTAGYADIYNPGSPGVAIVEIDVDSGSLRIVE